MRKIPKYAVGLALILLAGGLALLTLQFDGTTQNVPPNIEQNNNLGTESPSIHATIKADEVLYEVSLPKNSSVYDAMQAALRQTQGKQPNFHFSGQNFPGLGFFVSEINGQAASQREGKYWIYYVNGQKAQVGISSYIIKPNDVISWKYEKSNE